MTDNDLIHGIEKSVMGWIHPLIAGALAIDDESRLNEELSFIKEVLLQVNVDIKRLEARLDTEYMATREYKNFLRKTILKATNDLRKEKIKLFANIIVNAALEENTKKGYNRKYLYLDTIDKIDEHLFRFVCLLKSRCISKGKEIGKGWTGEEPELKKMGIFDEFRFNADYLLSLGVIVRLHQERHNESNGILEVSDEYYVTEYGVEFVNFVSEQESSLFTDAELVS